MEGQNQSPGKAQLVLLFGVVLLTVLSCTAVQSREDETAGVVLVQVTEPWPFTIVDDGRAARVELTRPVIPRVWYPGDGPVSEDSITYYAVRCWPGCHDPDSAPRPQHY